MLPFPRISEYGNIVVRKQYILDLDFRRQNVGDNSVIDYSPYSYSFTKLNALPAGIVYDSTLNTNVMYFNGGVFSTPIVFDLQLSTKNFEIDVMYKSTSNATQVLYGTGYYPDVSNRVSGMCHQIGQYPKNDQYFIDDGNTYYRHLLEQSVTSVWQRLVYTRSSGSVNIKRYRDSVLINEINYPNRTFGNGTSFGVGGYYKTPSSWNFYGYMQYLKLKIL